MTANNDWIPNPNFDPDSDDEAAQLPFTGVPYSDLRAVASDVGIRKWFAEGAIEGNPIVLFSGPEKWGKSFVAKDLAVSTIANKPWLGSFDVLPDTRAGVVYLDGEYGEHEFTRRVMRVTRGKGEDPWNILPCFRYLYSADLELSVDNSRLRQVARDIALYPPKLIVVDPFRNHLVGSENDTDAVVAAFKAINYLRGNVPCPVFVLHHLNKSGGQSGSRAMSTRPDLIIDGSDDETPVFKTKGRSLRHSDPIREEFSIRISHTNDDDDRVAITRLVRVTGSSALEDKILKLLADEPHSTNWLATKLKRSNEQMRKILEDLKARQLIDNTTFLINNQKCAGWSLPR